jgi:cytochrome oxidase Cu insertion factor (SCO1/SenC/PrrC family)
MRPQARRYAVFATILAIAIAGLLVWNQLRNVPPGGAPVTSLTYDPIPAGLAAVGLTDVRTGVTFRLADFEGRLVLLELMTVWCTNCVAQGDELAALLPALGERVVVVSIDVDPNESGALLAAYVEEFERTWRFAYDETGQFNTQFIIRSVRQEIPETPIYLISPDGSGIYKMRPGHKPRTEILQVVEQALAAGT